MRQDDSGNETESAYVHIIINLPIQKLHPLEVLCNKALTWNTKRSKDLLVAGTLLVTIVRFDPLAK